MAGYPVNQNRNRISCASLDYSDSTKNSIKNRSDHCVQILLQFIDFENGQAKRAYNPATKFGGVDANKSFMRETAF